MSFKCCCKSCVLAEICCLIRPGWQKGKYFFHLCINTDQWPLSVLFKGELISHHKSIHEDQKFPCPKCEFQAKQKGQLVNHYNSLQMGQKQLCPGFSSKKFFQNQQWYLWTIFSINSKIFDIFVRQNSRWGQGWLFHDIKRNVSPIKITNISLNLHLS